MIDPHFTKEFSMEPQFIKEFSSEHHFDIWDAQPGGHLLLLRSYGGDHDPVTTDLIFAGVLYVELPSMLYGLRVTLPCDDKAIEIEKSHTTFQCVSDDYKGEFVYAIESQGKRYHVVASTLWIQVHTLPDGQSTLFTFNMYGDEERRKEYYDFHLKEWYKIEPGERLSR
jgi:hypothetical protein